MEDNYSEDSYRIITGPEGKEKSIPELRIPLFR